MTRGCHQVRRYLLGAMAGVSLTSAAVGTCAAQAATAPSAEAAKPATFILLLRLRRDLYSRWKAAPGRMTLRPTKPWPSMAATGRSIAPLIVFRANSPEQAERMARDDPVVRAFVFQAQVRPFDPHFAGLAPKSE